MVELRQSNVHISNTGLKRNTGYGIFCITAKQSKRIIMGTTIKILIIENDPGDVELLQRQLKKADFVYNSEVVKTEKGYISALKIFAPDVILSDFVLPSFSGDAAFKIREQIAPETPFIFVSGTIGEEKAVEYIKNGVTDYVMKDKLFTVIIKIKRALRDVKEKQEKNKAEDELKKSEQRFRALIEKSKDMITLGNHEGELVYGSPFITEALGYSAEELINMNLFDVVHPDDAPELRERRDKLLKSPGSSFSFQHRRKHKSGNWVWCEGCVTNMLNEPAINAIVTNFRDVTIRKQAEQDLIIANNYIQKTLNELQKIMDSSLDVICSIDKEGTFLRVSEASINIWGYKPDELTGSNFINLVVEDDIEKTLNTDANVVNGVPLKMFENRYNHKNGKIVPMLWSANWDANDKIIYCIAKDITENKLAEAEREKLIQDLRLRNNELEQFAFVASHDLQEPLRMITSFMSLLEKKYGDVVDERGKQYIHFAVDGARRMRRIILDLLDFSKVGKTDDDLFSVDFNDLINEILTLYESNIEELKAHIIFENLPTLQTFKTPVSQIFQNLISNALKYHKPDEAPLIEITCMETATLFQFSVKDHGIGIATEYFEKIFIIFQRLHNKDEYSGTGMGLAIVKKITENLGGTIWVESEEGVGSTFHFTLIKKQ
jgi:PAS domain S-box-containing protein